MSTQSQSAASLSLPTTSLAVRRREARDTRVQPGGNLCIARQGVVQGMGSGTLFVNIVAGQCPAAMGINNNSAKKQTHLDIKHHLSGYGSAEAELALSNRFVGV